MGRVHELKSLLGHFDCLKSGNQSREQRADDRGYMIGDQVILKEFDAVENKYTGRECVRTIERIEATRAKVNNSMVVWLEYATLPAVKAVKAPRAARGQGRKVRGAKS